MSDELQVTVREQSGVTIVQVSGRFVQGQTPLPLTEKIKDLLERQRKKILLDFTKVTFIDSTGLGELVHSYTTIRRHNGDVLLLNPSPEVYKLLKVTQLDTVLEIHDELEQALARLESR